MMWHPRLSPEPSPDSVIARFLAWCDRYRWALFAAVAAVYLLSFNGRWWPGPDSAAALTVARNLAEGRGFTHPLGDHRTLPPGLAYLVAGTFRVAGVGNVWLANAVMLGFAGMAVALSYILFRLHASRPVAVGLTVLVALTETCYRYTFHLLADVPFLVGALMFLIGWELLLNPGGVVRPRRFRWLGAGLMLTGIAGMAAFRTVVVTVLGAAMLAGIWHLWRRGHRWTVGLGLTAMATTIGGLMAYGLTPGEGVVGFKHDIRMILSRFRDLETTITQTVPTNVWILLSEALPESVIAVDVNPLLAAPIGVGLLAMGLSLVVYRPLWGLLVATFTAQVTLFVVSDRYFLPLIPLFGFGWWCLAMAQDRRRSQPTGERLCAAMLLLWLVPNLIFVGRIVVQQRQTPYHLTIDEGAYAPVVRLADRLRDGAVDAEAVTIVPREFVQELVYLGSERVCDARGLRRLDPADEAIYVVEPMDPATRRLITRRGWRLGEPVLTIASATEAHPDREAWLVRPLRPANEAAPAADQ